MAKQYELFDDMPAFSDEDVQDITDILQESDAPDEIKESIASLAKSVPLIPGKAPLIPREASVKNYHKADQLSIMLDRFRQYGMNVEGMSVPQIYGKYFQTFEPYNYRKK
jgi:hypothetical protein